MINELLDAMPFQITFSVCILCLSVGVKETISQGEMVCYDNAGCYSQTPPWVSLTRPFPRPLSPQQIDVRFFLLTRKLLPVNTAQYEQYQIGTDAQFKPSRSSLQRAGYASEKISTVFIIHGFVAGIESEWMTQMATAYLSKLDANVFLVDWGKGARRANYLQVAANTRVVGYILQQFINGLIGEALLNPSTVHIVGHSLGAHIAAYAAKNIESIYRITGLDPAQIGFEGEPAEVRFDKDDAVFTDVLHTSAKPVVGLGYKEPLGDVDFYFNGIIDQPGCPVETFVDLVQGLDITSPADIPTLPVETIASVLSCSHSRSIDYFIEAVERTDCTMWGHRDFVSISRFIRMAASTAVPLPPFSSIQTTRSACNDLDACSPVGLETFLYPARGVFHVITHSFHPYCVDDVEITREMREKQRQYLESMQTR